MQASYILDRPSLDTRVEVTLTMTVRQLYAAASGIQKIASDAGIFSITVDDRRAAEQIGKTLSKVAEHLTDQFNEGEDAVRVELEEPFPADQLCTPGDMDAVLREPNPVGGLEIHDDAIARGQDQIHRKSDPAHDARMREGGKQADAEVMQQQRMVPRYEDIDHAVDAVGGGIPLDLCGWLKGGG